MPPTVGIPQALTYRYRSVRILERFLHEAGAQVIRSPKTTPEILAAATTLGSADFCLSLRLLVGHVHYLVTRYPDLDFLLVPNLCSEDGERTTTCSKYRDAGGVALRSLGSTIDYLYQHSDARRRQLAEHALAEAGLPPPAVFGFPVLLQPYVWSLDREHMLNACFGVYCDVFGTSPVARIAASLAQRGLLSRVFPQRERCRDAFDVAYNAVMAFDSSRLDKLLADPRRIRLAIVCREYLISEPLLTADLKAWFLKAGVRVVTPEDVRPEDLGLGPHGALAFYDSHRHFDAFVERVAPHVDGFILAGSFGCHPDAFILDLLLDRIRRQGIPAWVLRYDELVGSAGFATRYETIMRFLEQRRDQRLAARATDGGTGREPARPGPTDDLDVTTGRPANPDDVAREPLIVWPYMSDRVELVIGEIVAQAGLTPYTLPPKPVTDVTLALGGDTFVESCCPYAFSTGSFVESLREYFAAQPNGAPRRIVALTARGEGPCSFGLYLLGHERDVRAALRDHLRRGRHTLEFVSIGLSDILTFIRQLADLGDRTRLAPIVNYLRLAADGSLDRLSAWRRMVLGRTLWRAVGDLLAPARAKLASLEDVRAQALLVRAHETVRGVTTEVYRRGVARLAGAHAIPEIYKARDRALHELAAVPQDEEAKPRVVVVGETFVVQASFANRGVVDTLLGQHGIEVEEGMILSALVASYERDVRRRAWVSLWPVRPLLQALWRRNIPLLQQTIDGAEARPFMNFPVGGEGNMTVAHARGLLEAGLDGVVHLMPFKCMPEGIAKAPMAELCRLFGVPYLPLSFNRELEMERLRTEIGTFAALLHARVGQLASGGHDDYLLARAREIARRRALSRTVGTLHRRFRRRRFAVA